MASSTYISIVGFDKLQHYKNRNPPWIKLYVDLWENHEFDRLPDATKAHFVGLCVLASRHDNRIPYEPDWIAKRIGANVNIDFDSLFASKLLARCKQNAIPERETETEKRQSREETEQRQSPAMPDAVFEKLWLEYPSKDGRKQALAHFKASVKTVQDVEKCFVALNNYKAHLLLHPGKPIKNGSTWFNNWLDWYNWVEPVARNGNRGVHVHTERCREYGFCPEERAARERSH
jgi:hypothetical protein